MHIFFYTALVISTVAGAFKIDRAILAVNDNPNYYEYWQVVAEAWKRLGVAPTLVFVAHANVPIDENCGTVIRFQPIDGVDTVFQAQCIRLLAPAWFPDDVCIISDIDLIPMDPDIFLNSVKNLPDDAFVVYRQKYGTAEWPRYPICFNAAKGSIFAEIFGVDTRPGKRDMSINNALSRSVKKENTALSSFYNVRTVRDKLISWWLETDHAWVTDERMLYQHIHRWREYSTRVIFLEQTFDRALFFDKFITLTAEEIIQGNYAEIHLPKKGACMYMTKIAEILQESTLS